MRTAIDILCYTRSPEPSPLGLASQLGWFLEEFHGEGISVFSMREVDGPQRRDERLQDHLTKSIRQGGALPATWARSRGGRTRVIGINRLPEYQGVISLPGSGIRTPRDLRGRRIGLPLAQSPVESRRGESLFGILVALGLGGLGPSDVDLLSVRTAKTAGEASGGGPASDAFGEYRHLIAALERGEVDAIFVRGPRGLRATREAGARIVLDLCRHPDPLVRAFGCTPKPITVEEALLLERPDIVTRFLARVAAVGAWAERHPHETAAYFARESRCGDDEVREAFGPDLHRHQHIDLDQPSIDRIAGYKRFMLDWGFIHDDFDVGRWLEPRPLATLRGGMAMAAPMAIPDPLSSTPNRMATP